MTYEGILYSGAVSKILTGKGRFFSVVLSLLLNHRIQLSVVQQNKRLLNKIEANQDVCVRPRGDLPCLLG